ncbi:TolB family protein [Kitasatospora sp. NPDC057904]|uniref:TolB family protein n=1 Tax=Kitasatospora sp. NPDC057904 TaxID=3346275 RepID=UPI0036DCABA7
MNRARPTRHVLRAACTLAAAALACAAAAPAHADAPTGATKRVTVGTPGSQPDGASNAQGLSADGRFAVFTSSASNLLPGSGNGRTKVFVRDLWTGKVEREDVSTAGADADLDSYEATISGNGRFVAFTSSATNLGSGAGRATPDVYVHDRLTGRTEPVAATDPAKPQTGHSAGTPSISWDGRYVAFQSDRTDLAPAGVTPHGGTIYVTDRRTGKTRLVSIGADGTAANGSSASPVISADGRTVGFISKATNLIAQDKPGALHEDAFGDRTTADDLAPGSSSTSTGSGTGSSSSSPRILKPRSYPFYVRDLDDEETRLASPDGKGGSRGVENPSLSPDGRFAVFSAPVFHGTGPWDRHFEVFVRDLEQGTERSVTVALPGTTVRSDAWEGRMTADDRWVYFSSTADDLVPGDTNNASDVFRFDLWSNRTERVSVATDGSQSTGGSSAPFVDAFGTTVLFTSEDGTLVPDDSNKLPDVFVHRYRF